MLLNIMTELKEGKMTIKDLSIWFGLKPETLAKSRPESREKKFKILEAYADYHFEGKTLYIDKVKIPTYSKALEVIEKEMPKRWGVIKDKDGKIIEKLKKERIDTSARVGKEIWYKCPEVKSSVSIETSQVYTRTVKTKKYGRCHIANNAGTDGYSEYVRMNEDGTAPLSGKQLEIYNRCVQAAYGDLGTYASELDESVKNGEITKEERDKRVANFSTANSYSELVALCLEKLGFYPEQRTRLIDAEVFEK